MTAVSADSRTAPARRVLQVTPAALEQEVTRLLRRYAQYDERVLLLRADPGGHAPSGHALSGHAPGTLTVGDRQVRIVGCVSPLDVLDQVTRHVETKEPGVLVVLTTAEENDLGPGLLGHAIRQRVFTVEPWRLIEESFGAQHRDPRLTAEAWAGEALLDAMPPGGWPKLPGTVLTLDTAMRTLATRRLGLHRFGRSATDLDAAALLLWSCDPEAVGAFRTLRDAERRGLVRWLNDTFGGAVDVLFSLVEEDKAGDALALGLICGTLWAPQARDAGQRAQGGVLSYIKGARAAETKLSDQAVIDFAGVAVQLVGWMLAEHGNPDAARYAHTVLDRAEELLGRFGAEPLARHSALLRSGFDQRIDTVATALGSALRDHRKVAALAEAVADLRAHTLAGLDGYRHRVRRAEMAQRLMQWMATADGVPEQVTGVEAAVTSQVAQWGWVDRAGHDVWQGEDVDKALQRAYLELHTQVARRRRALDEAFAARLAEWTQVAAGTAGILTVEGVLPRILAPLATAPDGEGRPVLFLVLDGMSAAVAAELGEQLRAERWEEYDPLGGGDGNGNGHKGTRTKRNAKQKAPHRRGVVAALPTVTRVSRASLFAGRISDGTQAFERSVFEQHPAFRSRTARLFHRGDLPGNAGETLGEELARALGDDETPVVAVVLNTIDERLDKGHETAWRIKDITGLRALLDHARNQGRALVITSDHGHVLEHGSTLRRVAKAQSARHRAPDGTLAEGEVELVGPRVAGDDGRTVALWDPGVRYTDRKFGYHGGASLAEVTIPLLAFLPLGATPPREWSALPDQTPSWWSLDPAAVAEVTAAAAGVSIRAEPVPQPARKTAAKARKAAITAAAPPAGQGQLDFSMAQPAMAPPAMAEPATVEPAMAEARPEPTLADELLATELFKLRHRSVPRKVQLGKIRSAVESLTEAGGVLPLTVLAQRLGEQPVRASGFAATLGLILNVDSYPVLEIVDGGRNVRLDTTLLRRLFELTG